MYLLRAFLVLMTVPIFARAATIELNDGRIYSAEILSQDKERLTLDINGMHVQLPRGMIVSIDESRSAPAPLKNGEISLLPVTNNPPRVVGAAPAPEISNPPVRPPVNVVVPAVYEEIRPLSALPRDPMLRQRLRQAIDNLRNDLAVPDAQRTLIDLGDMGLAGLVEFGLYHESPVVRARSAQLLGDLGGRRVLKPLIEALFSAARPTVEPYQVNYIETLLTQISRITGQSFYAYVRGGTAAPLAAQRAIDWWQQHYAELPPQLGEPKLNASAENYAANLAVARGLKLQHRDFAGSNYATDWVPPAPPPGEIGAYPPPPIIPRSLELERNVSSSQEPAAEKPINTQRDDPGIRRQSDYMEKIREAQRNGTYR